MAEPVAKIDSSAHDLVEVFLKILFSRVIRAAHALNPPFPGLLSLEVVAAVYALRENLIKARLGIEACPLENQSFES
jgi:hypothetical protein